jgi:hypothetical protein
VEAGGVACWRCRKLIPPGAMWDLGHVPGGGRHPEHVDCNRRAGGKLGGAIRAPQMRTRQLDSVSKLLRR